MYLTAIRDDRDPPKDVPISYLMHVWRYKMKVGWFEAMQTPYQVMMDDLEMMSLEKKYTEPLPKPDNNKKGA